MGSTSSLPMVARPHCVLDEIVEDILTIPLGSANSSICGLLPQLGKRPHLPLVSLRHIIPVANVAYTATLAEI